MVIKSEQLDYDSLLAKYQELQSKERYLEIINGFSLGLMHSNTTEGVVWGIAKQVIARMNFEDCVIYLVDKEEGVLIQMAAHGPKNPYHLNIKDPIKIPLGKGIVGTVAVTGKAEIISDTRLDDRYILDDEPRLSEIAVPIIFENEVIGVIDSENTKPNFFTQEHLMILTTVAAMGSSKLINAKINEELKEYQFGLEKLVEQKTSELNQLVEKLKKSNTDLESFAYAASHDLQEPLRTIISYLQLIERKDKNFTPELEEYFSFVIKGATRMKGLLQGLLEYSRVNDLGTDGLVTLNMNDILIVIKDNLRGSLEQSGGQLWVGGLNEIKGNKTQIIQLFQNIISNAIKFRKPDTQPIVKVYSEIEDDYIEFKIEDNGIGIDPKFHEKIFGLFSRLNSVDSYKGSGIGLALCKRIVDYHHGKIFVCPEKVGGTCFRIRFPRG